MSNIDIGFIGLGAGIFLLLLRVQIGVALGLVSFIGISDLTYTAYQLNQTTYLTVEVFTIVLFIYFAIGLSITIGMRLLEQRFSRGYAAAGAS